MNERKNIGGATPSRVTGKRDGGHEAARANRSPSAFSLHIERLVIDGLPLMPVQRAQLQTAIEQELVRLAEDNRYAHDWLGHGAIPAIGAPAIQVSTAVCPVELGRQIAGSVFASLKSNA